MAGGNKRTEPVAYQPFKPKSVMADSLIPVDRPALTGDIERRLAAGWFRIADLGGNIADDAAKFYGEKQGRQDALAAAPQPAEITGLAENDSGSLENISGFTVGNIGDPADTNMEPHRRAFLNAIASVESGGKYNIRYTPKGGAEFSDFSRHPGILEPTKDGRRSSAAGRYQETESTHNDLGGGDMSPVSQDRRAWRLAARDYYKHTGRMLDRDLQNTENLPQIMAVLSPTWTGFKAGKGKAIAAYKSSIARYSGAQTAANAQDPQNIDKTITGSIAKAQEADIKQQDTVQGRISVAAPGIVPVSIKIEDKAQFKPQGKNTVYGRAYDAAGTRTYLQMLDTSIKADIPSLFDKAGNDLAAFDQGLAALKKAHYKDHAIPEEISADYEAEFARTALPYRRQIELNQQKQRDSQNKADFLNRSNELETLRQRRLVALTPDNPDATDALWNSQNALDDHYDSAVLHGILEPDQAEKAKIESRRYTAVNFYAKQAEGKSSADIAALREQMRADFTDGKLANLDSQGWTLLDSHLGRLEQQADIGQGRIDGEYLKQGNALVARIEQGYNIDQAEISAFAMGQNRAKNGYQVYEETMAKLDAAAKIRDLPLPAAFDYVARLRQEAGKNPDKTTYTKLNYAQESLNAKRNALMADPLSYAENMGIIPPTGSLLDEQTPEAISQRVEARVNDSNLTAQSLGVPPRFLKPGEGKAIAELARERPQDGLNLISALIKSGGERANDILLEFGPDAPQIAQAGSIMAGNGSQEAALDLLAAYGKNPDGQAYKTVPRENRLQKDEDILGDALDLLPADKERITAAAGMIAKKRVYDTGAVVKDSGNDDLYEKALQQAAGQVETPQGIYGGFVGIKKGRIFNRGGQPVYVDPQIRADILESLFGAIKIEDFDNRPVKPVDYQGKPVSTGLFSSYYPIAVPGGYIFSAVPPGEMKEINGPVQMIFGSDGKPFVFNPLEYRNVLEARVPGAFRD